MAWLLALCLGLTGCNLIHRPNPDSVVVVVHGGGWAGGTPADTASLASQLNRDGFDTVNVDYPLTGYPAEQESVQNTVNRLAAEGYSRIGVLGISAGGTLALNLSGVSVVVAWSAPINLAGFESGQIPDPGLLSMPYAVYHYMGCLPAQCRLKYQEATPYPRKGTRYQLWYSQHDFVPPGSQLSVFPGAEVHIVPGNQHAAEYYDQAMKQSVAFIDKSLQ